MPTKEQILHAARGVIQTQGLSRATTREIARAAGCAEGSIYKHFADKDDLLICALQDVAPPFFMLLGSLESRAGQRTVKANLEEIAREAVPFFSSVLPVSATLFSHPDLLVDYRKLMKENDVGPQRVYELLSSYVRAEQKLGRITPKAKPPAVAALLMGACYQFAALKHLLEPGLMPLEEDRFPGEVVRTLLEGLTPRT